MTQSDTATAPDAAGETPVEVNGRPLDEVKESVLAAAKHMYARGLVEGTAGNVSGRVDDGTVVVTPSSLGYDEMTLDDLVQVTLDGEVVSGERSPTSEKAVHLCALRRLSRRSAAWCTATPSTRRCSPSPTRTSRPPSTSSSCTSAATCRCATTSLRAATASAPRWRRKLVDRSAALMANHGLVAIGKSVDDALHSAFVVEHNAQIFWGAKLLGGVVELPEKAQRNFTGVYDYIRREHLDAGLSDPA